MFSILLQSVVMAVGLLVVLGVMELIARAGVFLATLVARGLGLADSGADRPGRRPTTQRRAA